MSKLFFCILFFFLAVTKNTFCQGKLKVTDLPVSTQTVFKQLTEKYHNALVNYETVENDLRKNNIDFSKMPVEDAVMMMFMLISEDARKDMKEMLIEMEATRKKRDAFREAEELMKREIDSLKNQARNKYDSLSNLKTKKLTQKELQLTQIQIQQKAIISKEYKLKESKNTIEKHLQSVEEAIKKLRKLQTQNNKL